MFFVQIPKKWSYGASTHETDFCGPPRSLCVKQTSKPRRRHEPTDLPPSLVANFGREMGPQLCHKIHQNWWERWVKYYSLARNTSLERYDLTPRIDLKHHFLRRYDWMSRRIIYTDHLDIRTNPQVKSDENTAMSCFFQDTLRWVVAFATWL